MNLDLPVYSFFENVVLMVGWIVNNAIWAILNHTMVAALPFLAVIVREWYAARREGEDEGNKGLLSLNRIEASLYAMLLVYGFAAVPLMGVQFAPAHIDPDYQNQCDVQVMSGTGPATGSGASIGGQSAEMPIWWAAIHAFSTGITNVMIAALPCQPDYKYLQTKLDTTRIQDPELRRELAHFQVWCFGQARYKLFQESDTIDDDRARDTDWLGSSYFLNTPGYYDRMRAQGPIKSFAYNAQRDSGYGTTPDQGGYPTCKQWWSASGHGLEARLRQQLNTGFWDYFHSVTHGSLDADQYAIRGLLQHQDANGNVGTTSGGAGGNLTDRLFGIVGGALGVTLSTIPAKGMEDVAGRAMPMVQYLVLMVIVIAMPFVVVFSGYSFKAVGLVTFAYIGTTTLTFWFQLSHWLQNHLVDMTYHSDAAKLGFMSNLTSFYDQGVMGLVQAVMLFLFPPLWIGALGWAGYAVGSGINNAMSNGSNEASNAGKKGGEKGQNTASGGKL